MSERFPLSIDSIPMLAAGLAIVAAAIAIAWWRRARMPVASKVLSIGGLVLLSLAAAGVSWRGSPPEVVVMVDRSPSTRGASYHDERQLADRLRDLLGNRRPSVVDFTNEFAPPAADAIVLFSDGRFAPPPDGLPPVYPVIDPELESPDDARVADLEQRDAQAVVHVENRGSSRTLRLTGAREPGAIDVAPGDYSIARPLAPDTSRIVASLDASDRWPENDRLTLLTAPEEKSQRWWIGGTGAVSGDWKQIARDGLPTDPASYLAPAIIVLDNIRSADLSDERQMRLSQYVRDLGGSLLLIGGDRAFSTSGANRLDELSPLSSDPPAPVTRWILLADSSGSMAAPHEGRTRWAFAADAMLWTLQSLPPHDYVTIGGFAGGLTWWSADRTVADTRTLPLPPSSVHPRGPTNLQSALQQIAAAAQTDGAAPTQLLLLTDGQATIDDPNQLAESLKSGQIHLHLLATGPLDASAALREIVERTGGTIVTELDPSRWTRASEQLLQRMRPSRWMSEPIVASFRDALAALAPRELSGWNRTWLKPDARLLAEGMHHGESVPLAASWRIGAGQVAAVGFAADRELIEQIRQRIEAPPRDPRLALAWMIGSAVRVRVDAQEENRPINDLSLFLRWPDIDAAALAQVAPGRYEASVAAPREPVIAEVIQDDGTIIARKAVAGRYDLEFEVIGNDHEALQDLATQTGGRVIAADDRREIHFPFAPRTVSLVRHLSLAGACLLAVALIIWRAR